MAIEKQNEFNGMIKAIFRGGKVNKINWGEEGGNATGWNAWSDKQKLEFSMELASAMNQAAEYLQIERNELLEKLDIAEKTKEAAEQGLEIQKQIVLTTLTEDNDLKNKYIQDIQRLTAELAQANAKISALEVRLTD